MAGRATSIRATTALVGLVAGYVLLAMIAGAPESPLTPLPPAGVGLPAWSVRGAELLGLDEWSRTGLTVVALLVLAGVASAFFVVLVEAWRGRVRLVVVGIAVAASLTVATAAPLLLSRDVYGYAAFGRIFTIHDSNPYLEPPSEFPSDPFARAAPAVWVDTPSVYGPAFTLLSAGVASSFQDSPHATVVTFKVLAGVAMALAVALVTAAARSVLPGREALVAAGVGLNPAIVLHTVGGGHNDAMIAALVAGAVLVATKLRDRISTEPVGVGSLTVTVLLVLGAMTKLVLAIPLLLWVWALANERAAGRRARVIGVHLGLSAVVGAALLLPFFDGVRSLRAMASLASLEGWASGTALVAKGAREIGELFGDVGVGDVLAGVVAVAFLLIVVIGLLSLGRSAMPESVGFVWGAGLLLFALGAPYLSPWYAAWLVPLLFFCDFRLMVVGLVASVALAMTGVPAEPGPLYEGMRLAVHYVAAPVMLVLFAVTVHRILRLGDGAQGSPVLEPLPSEVVPQ